MNIPGDILRVMIGPGERCYDVLGVVRQFVRNQTISCPEIRRARYNCL